MLKKIVLIFLFFFVFRVESAEFYICYQPLTSGKLFYIHARNGQLVNIITREQAQNTIQYTLYSPNESPLALGLTRQNNTETLVHVESSIGQKMGGFAATIYNLYPSEYRIIDENNRPIAVGYLNWLGNNLTFYGAHNSRQVIATFFRPRFKLFNDYWHFEIHEEGILDFSLLAMIGTFQTACDLHFEINAPK